MGGRLRKFCVSSGFWRIFSVYSGTNLKVTPGEIFSSVRLTMITLRIERMTDKYESIKGINNYEK